MSKAILATPLGKPAYPLGAWEISNPDRTAKRREEKKESLLAPLKQTQAREKQAGWGGDWKAGPLQNSWFSLGKGPQGCPGEMELPFCVDKTRISSGGYRAMDLGPTKEKSP